MHGVPGLAGQDLGAATRCCWAATSTTRRSRRRPSAFNPVTRRPPRCAAAACPTARATAAGASSCRTSSTAMPGPAAARGQPALERRRVRGAGLRQPAGERPAAVARRLRGLLEPDVPRRAPSSSPAELEPLGQREPRLPRAAHHRPRHARPHRLGLRGRRRPRIAGLGATVGSTAGASAVSTGQPAEQLAPETSLNYEAGIRYPPRQLDTDLVGFVNDVDDNIQKQALILPPGAVGTPLGDQVVTRQAAGGAVFVPVSSSPVLVNANFDDARIWGIEHTLDVRASARLDRGHRLHVPPRRGRPDRTCRPTSRGARRPPDGWLRDPLGAGRGSASGSSPTSTRPRARTGSRAWTWRTGAPAPRAPAAASRASSTTARGPAA